MKPDAIDQLYEKHYHELYYYALNLCKQDATARDLVNETFYKALIASDHPRGPFRYWLFRVLKNLFIDGQRKNREIPREDLSNNQGEASPYIGPADSLLLKDGNRRLHNHLMALTPEVYREVLYLYYFGELSVSQIAETIGKSKTHTKTLLHRARRKLGKELKEDCYEF